MSIKLPSIYTNSSTSITEISSRIEGSSFYRKFSNGLIIQGGRIAPASANHAYSNFPTPFDHACHCVICTINGNETGGAKTRVVYNVTASGFNHNGMWGEDGSQSVAFYWLAIGY